MSIQTAKDIVSRLMAKGNFDASAPEITAYLRDKNTSDIAMAISSCDDLSEQNKGLSLINPKALANVSEALVQEVKRRDVKDLIKLLKDSDSDAYKSAVDALGMIGEPAVNPLITMLVDANEDMRLGAMWALGKIGKPAVEALITALKAAVEDADLDMLKGVVPALGEVGGPAVEPLITLLENADSQVRESAVWVLGKIGDVRAVEPLVAALEDEDENVGEAAAVALEKIRDAAA
jgi:HEAT repeat protein